MCRPSLAAVNERICGGARLVAIDGVGNAGKSTARAQMVAGIDGAIGVELDDFLNRGQGQFVGALRIADLKRELASNAVRVVSGVCMRNVLDSLGIEADAHVYVKRMRPWGWADQDEVDDEGFIEEIAGIAGVSPNDASLALEVRRYHQDRRPQDCADIVYQRSDSIT